MTDATPTPPGDQVPGAYDPTTVQPAVPPTPPPTTPGTGGPGGSGGDGGKKGLITALVVVAVLALILLIVVLVMAFAGGSSKSSNTTTSSSTTSSSTTSSSTTSTTAPTTSSTAGTTSTTATNKPVLVSLNVPTQVACPGTTQITLSWNYANASKVTISIDGPGIYDTYAPVGSTQVGYSCAEAQHTYLFTATGPNGVTTNTRVVKSV